MTSEQEALIKQIHDHVEAGDVDNAVFSCLRLARSINDALNAVLFLREMRSDHEQFKRQYFEEVKELSKKARTYAWRATGEIWLQEHTMDASLVPDEPEKTVLAMGVGEMRRDILEIDKKIADMVIPQGLGQFDAAAFEDRYSRQKALLRMRASAIHQLLERIRNRCFDYASRVEEQLRASARTVDFLSSVQITVHNYFAAHHVETHERLLKANELVASAEQEDFALLLTAVRRAIKSIADHFLPPSDEPRLCSDGKTRVLGEEKYLNRLDEFCNTLPASTSSELIKAELAHLSVFARRLNDIASKGVHANVTLTEARQGLLGLYLFTSNIISRLEDQPTEVE